jgi:hypothetical protein
MKRVAFLLSLTALLNCAAPADGDTEEVASGEDELRMLPGRSSSRS